MNPKTRDKHRKILWFALALILVVAGTLAWRWYRHHHETWHGPIDAIFPADLDNNGHDDALLVLHTYYGRDDVPFKLIDMKTGDVRWRSFTLKGWSSRNLSHVVHIGDLFILGSFWVPEKSSIMAYDAGSGEPRWAYPIPPPGEPGLYVALSKHQDLVFVHTRQGSKTQVTALEAASGAERWTAACQGYSHHPVFVADTVYLPGTDGCVIDLEQASSRTEGAMQAYGTGEGMVLLVNRTIMARSMNDKLPAPVEQEGKPLRLPADASRTAVAVHDGRIVCTSDAHTTPPHRLQALPYLAGKSGFSYEFGEGFYLRDIFFRWKRAYPEISSFHVIEARHVPLLLRREVNDTTDDVKLVVFDLVDGRPSWESKAVRQKSTAMLAHYLFRHGDRYLIYFRTDVSADDEPILLVLDGRSGSFTGAVDIRREGESALRYLHLQVKPEHLSSNRFYGYDGPDAWALDLDTLQMVFRTSDRLQVVDAKPRAEAMLGPMR